MGMGPFSNGKILYTKQLEPWLAAQGLTACHKGAVHDGGITFVGVGHKRRACRLDMILSGTFCNGRNAVSKSTSTLSKGLLQHHAYTQAEIACLPCSAR